MRLINAARWPPSPSLTPTSLTPLTPPQRMSTIGSNPVEPHLRHSISTLTCWAQVEQHLLPKISEYTTKWPTKVVNYNQTAERNVYLGGTGGVGGGGACGGGKECDQLETSFGQIYRLPINYGTYDTDNSGTVSNFASPIREGFASGSVVSPQQIRAEIGLNYLSLQGTEWSFARLSDNSDEQTFESSGNSQAGQGRLLKTWGLESVCYDHERGLLYELGGLQAVPIDMAKGNQRAREYSGPTMLDTGNHLGGNGDAN